MADLMRHIGVLLCLTVLGLVGYAAVVHKAPLIEADIERRVAAALLKSGNNGVDIQVDGRHVTLETQVADDERRREILSTVAAVTGALSPVDGIAPPDAADPYRISATKDDNGSVAIQGQAPTEEDSASIEANAKALFGDEVTVAIEIFDGAPSDSWRAATITALDALATLRQGKVSITDADIQIEGHVTTEADIAAVDIFAEAAPDGFSWRQDVAIRQDEVSPFTFSVMKNPDGSLSLSGFAPDEETRALLIDEGRKAVGRTKPVSADIKIADGMPGPEWPSLVIAGIGALDAMEAGRFDVTDNEVSFSSDPDDPGDDQQVWTPPSAPSDDAPALMADGGGDGTALADTESDDAPASTADGGANGTVLADTESDDAVNAALALAAIKAEPPASALTVEKAAAGVWSIRGTVPDQSAEDELVAAIRQRSDVRDLNTELQVASDVADEGWLRFAASHLKALDEVSAGRLSLEDFDAHLIGVVETPEQIAEVKQSLAAFDGTMMVELQPIDPRPIASLDLKISPDQGVSLSGTLPGDLSEGEALLALGIRRYDGKLEENARGPADSWREKLADIGEVLPDFETIELSLGGERPRIEGRTLFGRDADAIAGDLALALGDDAQPLVEVETTTTIPEDDDRRTNPLTGKSEFHRRGYWLPVIDVAVDPGTCRDETERTQQSGEIQFERWSDQLDASAERTLNALAGLVIACVDNTDLVLEIGGHTDSRGGADLNRELSQTRADVVLNALIARGIDADALIAVGYGDARPIADNATAEGRAANRRITFEWKSPSDAGAASGRG